MFVKGTTAVVVTALSVLDMCTIRLPSSAALAIDAVEGLELAGSTADGADFAAARPGTGTRESATTTSSSTPGRPTSTGGVDGATAAYWTAGPRSSDGSARHERKQEDGEETITPRQLTTRGNKWS